MTEPAAAPRRAVRERGFFAALFTENSPIDLHIVGRTLIQAALVGVAAGLMCVVFFAGLELVERVLLDTLAGYQRLRASGETVFAESGTTVWRWWLIPIIPAVGALLGGVLTTRLAPEAQGGGGDAMIDAFHHAGGGIRRRVAFVKAAASILTLGSGGAGGREGPTMQIGAAIGSGVARSLGLGARERRILMISGVAAGMSAIFRTPLGAALLATEVLYRDDFEGDALIPALLASVVSYSIFISFYGESTLFSHSEHFPFVPAHLPLYALLALLVALLAIAFVKSLELVKRVSTKVPLPAWVRPGLGGLALGIFATPILYFVGNRLHTPGQGFGMLGGGYGAAQVAMIGASWLPQGWGAVEILALLCFAKLVAASLTLGTGGSAGDFAPSLVLGGVFGGAFGRAAALLLHDPRIDPGAFALVGMGTFYGGIAHVPIASLVMVCELAGSYDLLVPLMLAEGIAFVALRKYSLYHAQVPSKRDSPAHPSHLLDVLAALRVGDVMRETAAFISFKPGTPARDILRSVSEAKDQDVFPVLGDDAKILGMITDASIRVVAAERDLAEWVVAADAMEPPLTLLADDTLKSAAELLLSSGAREVIVIDARGKIAGFLEESHIAQAYVDSMSKLEERAPPSSMSG